MISKRFLRKTKAAVLASLMAGGMLLSSSCTIEDLQKNLIAGSLGYVKSHATAFWNAFVPPTEVWTGFFEQTW